MYKKKTERWHILDEQWENSRLDVQVTFTKKEAKFQIMSIVSWSLRTLSPQIFFDNIFSCFLCAVSIILNVNPYYCDTVIFTVKQYFNFHNLIFTIFYCVIAFFLITVIARIVFNVKWQWGKMCLIVMKSMQKCNSFVFQCFHHETEGKPCLRYKYESVFQISLALHKKLSLSCDRILNCDCISNTFLYMYRTSSDVSECL